MVVVYSTSVDHDAYSWAVVVLACNTRGQEQGVSDPLEDLARVRF